MADKRNIHTVKVDDGWAGRRAGSDRTGKRYATKAKAEAANRATARRDGVEHISHRADGTIGERRSYGKTHGRTQSAEAPRRSSAQLGTAGTSRAAHETPERAVRQVIASSRLEGCPEPTPEQEQRMLSVARGDVSANDAVAEILSTLQ